MLDGERSGFMAGANFYCGRWNDPENDLRRIANFHLLKLCEKN